MYIHIGGDYSVSDRFIVGIFDFDSTTHQYSDTIKYLQYVEKNGSVDVISPDLPRSFIVTVDRVYISPLSASTIQKRLKRKGYYDK